MATYILKRRNEKVGVINAIPDGFVVIDAEELWPHLQAMRYIGYSPVKAITCNNILSIRIDVSLGSLIGLESDLNRMLDKLGYHLEPIE
jgi:hypothetical protein